MFKTLHALVLLAPLAVGCGSAHATAPQNPDPNDSSHKGNTAELVEGAPLFAAKCAKCHGPTGKGSDDGPAVVGEGALPLNPPAKAKLRKGQFATAKDLFDFIKANMPKDKPGSLSDDQVYAIVAFDLKANGLDLHGMKVDPTTAPTIRLPGR